MAKGSTGCIENSSIVASEGGSQVVRVLRGFLGSVDSLAVYQAIEGIDSTDFIGGIL